MGDDRDDLAGSPWDEPLEEPDEGGGSQQIVGTLDPTPEDIDQPVPFNIPKDVGEEKVGKKLPASKFISDKDQKQGEGVGSLLKKQNPDNTPSDPNPQGPEAQAGETVASPQSQLEEQKRGGVGAVGMQSEAVSQGQRQKEAVSQQESTQAQPVETSPNTIKESPRPNQASQLNNQNKQLQSSNAETKTVNSDIKPPQDAGLSKTTSPAVTNAPQGKTEEPASAQEMPQSNTSLRGQQGGNSIAVPQAIQHPVAQPSDESIAATTAEEKKQPGKISALLQKIFSFLPKRKQQSVKTDTDFDPSFSKDSVAAKEDTQTAPVKPRKSGPPIYQRPKFVIVFSALALFISLVFLTELGLLSLGLEKAYGVVGLESLWGGLPRNPEKALFMSFSNMEKHPHFQIEGDISLTVDKSMDSDVVSPLVNHFTTPTIAYRDVQESVLVRSAKKAQYDDLYDSDDYGDYYQDYYDDIPQDDSSVESPSTGDYDTDYDDSWDRDYEDEQQSGESYDYNSSGSETNSSDIGTGSDSGGQNIDQDSFPAYRADESTIKELTADLSGKSSAEGMSLDVAMRKITGRESNVWLKSSGQDLYVKSSPDIKFNSKAEQSKWLNYNLSNISENGPLADILSAEFDQGFSIIGRRVDNVKMAGVRCYRYKIDNLEIGDSLGDMGITSDMIQKISGDVWIGVADKLPRKLSLTILPSLSSAVSRIDVNLFFSEYDLENKIDMPALDEKVSVASPEPSDADYVDDNDDGFDTGSSEDSGDEVDTVLSRDLERKSSLKEVKDALGDYKKDRGYYPIAESLIKINDSQILQNALVPEFLDVLPKDPKSSEGWFYGYTSDGSTFRLSARLEDTSDPETTVVDDIYIHYVYND